jgi:hypothetical protein
VVWGSPADPAAYPAGPFDVVYDNNGKKLEDCQPLIDHFKVRGAQPYRLPAVLPRTAKRASPRTLISNDIGLGPPSVPGSAKTDQYMSCSLTVCAPLVRRRAR